MNPDHKIRNINPDKPDLSILKEAAEIIRKGGVVVFPTQCLYGLAADALNPDAVAKIFRIKNRPLNKPLLILIKDIESVEIVATEISYQARKLMKQFWPGNLTIIFRAKQNLLTLLTGNSGKIGIRLPFHNIAFILTGLLDNPITGTSANLSGMPGCFDVKFLDPKVLNEVDMVLDAGPLKGGTGSTVIDVTDERPVILREGSVLSGRIWPFLEKA